MKLGGGFDPRPDPGSSDALEVVQNAMLPGLGGDQLLAGQEADPVGVSDLSAASSG